MLTPSLPAPSQVQEAQAKLHLQLKILKAAALVLGSLKKQPEQFPAYQCKPRLRINAESHAPIWCTTNPGWQCTNCQSWKHSQRAFSHSGCRPMCSRSAHMASQAATHGHLLWSAGISGKEEEAPILICLKCGYYTQHRLNALGRQCGKKGPPSALKRIRQGRRPAHPHILLNKLIKVRATTLQGSLQPHDLQ